MGRCSLTVLSTVHSLTVLSSASFELANRRKSYVLCSICPLQCCMKSNDAAFSVNEQKITVSDASGPFLCKVRWAADCLNMVGEFEIQRERLKTFKTD
jgi:hypothetical protein